MHWHKLSTINFGLLMLCVVLSVCLSLPSVSEEDPLAPPPARKMLRLLPNTVAPRIKHDHADNNKRARAGDKHADKKSTHKARQADIDDMMEHLLRMLRRSMRATE